MAKSGQVNVAIVGLGFGAEFIPIYQAHPDANICAICRRNEAKLNEIGTRVGVLVADLGDDVTLSTPAGLSVGGLRADAAGGVQQMLGLLRPCLDEETAEWMQLLIDRYN